MSRLAAVVRAHTGEDIRARAVANALAAAHDSIVIAPDETGGAIDAGPFEKRPHTLAGLAGHGLTIPKHTQPPSKPTRISVMLGCLTTMPSSTNAQDCEVPVRSTVTLCSLV